MAGGDGGKRPTEKLRLRQANENASPLLACLGHSPPPVNMYSDNSAPTYNAALALPTLNVQMALGYAFTYHYQSVSPDDETRNTDLGPLIKSWVMRWPRVISMRVHIANRDMVAAALSLQGRGQASLDRAWTSWDRAKKGNTNRRPRSQRTAKGSILDYNFPNIPK
ncbi:hypothetical protein U9M48_025853 [Paspalum notatum var. saurae]|uniref:Uncharacterized protein n=1 Tax=Paspalum notatum var. saurae TaxID=547442 RepID=A0AAQ3WXR6_PASNO